MLSAMSPMRPRGTGSLAQAGNLVPYAHPLAAQQRTDIRRQPRRVDMSSVSLGVRGWFRHEGNVIPVTL